MYKTEVSASSYAVYGIMLGMKTLGCDDDLIILDGRMGMESSLLHKKLGYCR